MKDQNEIMKCGKLRTLAYTDDGGCGYVKLYAGHGKQGNVVWSVGLGWDHVSLSYTNRVPTWDEMCELRDMFFEDEECVVQIHPKKSEYINNHPHCLHLWRYQIEDIPTPPSFMVGLKPGQTRDDIERDAKVYAERNGFEW